MKKYILYDDKVYEIKVNKEDKEQHFADYYYIKTSPYVKLRFTKNELKEYKTANTIEELCDEFVVIMKDEPLRPLLIYGVVIKQFFKNNKDFSEIYGATWTDKGLIYVAKLNDKGELELI